MWLRSIVKVDLVYFWTYVEQANDYQSRAYKSKKCIKA